MNENSNLSDNAKKDLLNVQAAMKGNQKAFEKLFLRYKDAIFYFLLRTINNRTDAEDLTLECFGKAFRNINQYSTKYAFSTWLFRIATNTSIDFIRKKNKSIIKFETKDDNDIDMPKFESQNPSPEQQIINKQDAIFMRRKVSQLKDRYRILIELRYFKEYSYEEIAKEMNLPIGTIKAQLFRARKLLFDNISDEDL
ncbi:sigma-70 family RNA polymerase sigma factor [Ancylomarina salipaludis]|uniref:Sigma-70 family RNA polymerase sigma factor n=1 Tax=Ancylomarina salipaludis TaxID=2501299 RepID=A0A4Q1JHM2_9BACT|nr:sigma-70 family RNA polymerase sigma factor [Ancylomarina salipaludis]RXQ87493.1 sigma-70 family RNA polymerase sigma factor [Ancylomarina salipaludis]